jgi:ribosomal protein S27AE
MVYLGSKVKDKQLTKVQAGLKNILPEGEFIVAIFKANRAKPLIDVIIMTNQRFLSAYSREINQGKFPNQMAADEIVRIEAESKKFNERLKKLFIIHRDGTKEFIADFSASDYDAILKIFDKMSGSPIPLQLNEYGGVGALSEEQLENLKVRVEKHKKSKYQSTCPRCGSDNLQAIQETRTRGVSTASSTAGCCCLGPIGLLCGLPGAGRSSSITKRMCLNCGKKF